MSDIIIIIIYFSSCIIIGLISKYIEKKTDKKNIKKRKLIRLFTSIAIAILMILMAVWAIDIRSLFVVIPPLVAFLILSYKYSYYCSYCGHSQSIIKFNWCPKCGKCRHP